MTFYWNIDQNINIYSKREILFSIICCSTLTLLLLFIYLPSAEANNLT